MKMIIPVRSAFGVAAVGAGCHVAAEIGFDYIFYLLL